MACGGKPWRTPADRRREPTRRPERLGLCRRSVLGTLRSALPPVCSPPRPSPLFSPLKSPPGEPPSKRLFGPFFGPLDGPFLARPRPLSRREPEGGWWGLMGGWQGFASRVASPSDNSLDASPAPSPTTHPMGAGVVPVVAGGGDRFALGKTAGAGAGLQRQRCHEGAGLHRRWPARATCPTQPGLPAVRRHQFAACATRVAGSGPTGFVLRPTRQ